MKNNFIKISIFFIAVLTLLMAFFLNYRIKHNTKIDRREDVVALNEIKELTNIALLKKDTKTYSQLENAINLLQQKMLNQSEGMNHTSIFQMLLLFYIMILLFLIIVFTYIYRVVIRPFDKLSQFANEVASGNFDLPLLYERTNLFGAFTWAFDNMRREIKKARACEKEAIENNKTVIATISHDIKTPIASIRAYAEGLEANMDSNPERRKRYLSVIMSKCDEVSKLTNDLFLHSLSNLEMLKMNLESCEAKNIVINIIQGIKGENDRVQMKNEMMDCFLHVDIRRLEQVFENIISNCMKYSKGSQIDITFYKKAEEFHCHIRDYGSGIASEDMPFIFEKFYRGMNTLEQPGSGLGLYIVKYIMEQMDGSVKLINHKDGLEVILILPLELAIS